MKKLFLLIVPVLFVGCETIQTPDGPRSVLSPTGVAIVNTAVSTGVGSLSGMAMQGASGPIVGAVASGAGSVVSQTLSSVLPTKEKIYREYQNKAIEQSMQQSMQNNQQMQ